MTKDRPHQVLEDLKKKTEEYFGDKRSDDEKAQARVSDMKKHVKAINQRIELGVFKSQEEQLDVAKIKLGLAIDKLELPLIEKSVAGLLERTKALLG